MLPPQSEIFRAALVMNVLRPLCEDAPTKPTSRYHTHNMVVTYPGETPLVLRSETITRSFGVKVPSNLM